MGKPHVAHHREKKSNSSGNRNKQFNKGFGNVHEGHGYADKRKRKIINQYRKIRKHMLKKESSQLSSQDTRRNIESNAAILDVANSELNKQSIDEQTKVVGAHHDERRHKGDNKKSKMTRFSKVEIEFKQQKLMNEQQAQDSQRIREEKKVALEKYKSKKRARHKKLSQKSKKGQPIMKYHVEHLLKKIRSDNL